MRRWGFSVFILFLITHTCAGEILLPTQNEHLTRRNTALVDILMTCYGDPGSAVGVVGDSDGSILKALWSNYSIPVALVDTAMTRSFPDLCAEEKRHSLKVFVVAAASADDFIQLMGKLIASIWWTHYANILIVSSTPDIEQQCSNIEEYLYVAFKAYGVLGAQFICIDNTTNVAVFDSNPFTPKAPKSWQFLRSYQVTPTPLSKFKLTYEEGGKNCDALKFDKTSDLGGYPFEIMMPPGLIHSKITNTSDGSSEEGFSNHTKKLTDAYYHQHFFFIDNIVYGMNASTVIYEDFNEIGIIVTSYPISGMNVSNVSFRDRVITSWKQYSWLAVTQHTAHKSQLEKILSIIDRESRIGMWIVYLITFLFFKFLLRESVIRALLNLVLLTCNTGLTTLPQNLAPQVYLTTLFMFVVTMQGIYTGDLASLLTQTIAYPHVDTIQDMVDLGYKIYSHVECEQILAADPILDGHAIKAVDLCLDYILHDPLVVCVMEYKTAVITADYVRLHLSRETIKTDHAFHLLSRWNPLGRKLQARVRRFDEHGLHPDERLFVHAHSGLVNDDAVNNNLVRRVMNLNDLMFAFVILAVGLTCSLVCFIGEIIIHRISLRIAKRRNRVRSL